MAFSQRIIRSLNGREKDVKFNSDFDLLIRALTSTTGLLIYARKPNEVHHCNLAEQLRETRIRILRNGIGKGLHTDVLVVEPGLGS